MEFHMAGMLHEALMNQISLVLSLILLSSAVSGCGPVEAEHRGQELFAESSVSVSPSNLFSCSTCHATTQQADGARRLPGYTLYGAPQRASYWGGSVPRLIDAVNVCVVDFMRGEPLSLEDSTGLALLAYLRSLSAAPDDARPLTIVRNIDPTYVAQLPPGDSERGDSLYHDACAYCHGDVHSGKGRLGSRVSILPDATVEVFGGMARSIMIEKIRHGKFFHIGGNMPMYATEMLSDAEVADIVEYLMTH